MSPNSYVSEDAVEDTLASLPPPPPPPPPPPHLASLTRDSRRANAALSLSPSSQSGLALSSLLLSVNINHSTLDAPTLLPGKLSAYTTLVPSQYRWGSFHSAEYEACKF